MLKIGRVKILHIFTVALFAQDLSPYSALHGRSGLFMGGGFYLLAAHSFSALCLTLWGAGQTYVYLKLLNKFIHIRMTPQQENDGADPSEHDIQLNKDIHGLYNDLEYIIQEMKISGRWHKPANFKKEVCSKLTCV